MVQEVRTLPENSLRVCFSSTELRFDKLIAVLVFNILSRREPQTHLHNKFYGTVHRHV